MRIAFDQQIFSLQMYGGISRYICSLATNLANIEGVESKIIAPFHVNTYLEKLPNKLVSGIKVPRIPKTGRAVQQVSSWLARSSIENFSPQIVHETYYSRTSSLCNDSCSVITVHDLINERFPSMFSQNDRTSEWMRNSAQRADHIICVSENTRKDLLEFIDLPKEKVSVVYHGFDSLLSERLEYNNKNKPYLLYVGQRGGYKNFDGFIRSYASSAKLQNNFNVICFGGGPFTTNEIKSFIELKFSDTQILQVNGNDNKLANYYRDAALFIYPSIYEGFGIPPLEAMSLGCPVACSNISSIPEVVGNAAEYFDPNNIESIRTAIEHVLYSPERQDELIKYGNVRSIEFSWERCATETLAIYRSLV